MVEAATEETDYRGLMLALRKRYPDVYRHIMGLLRALLAR